MEKIEKTYKVRKAGNSLVTTLPPKVREALNLEDGDQVIFLFNDEGKVEIQKEEPTIDVLAVVEEAVTQYRSTLDKLADM